jgi:hypothetical protein
MRLLAVVALAVPAMLYGHALDGLAAGRPATRAVQPLSVGDLRVQHRAPGGRVRGSVAAAPAGTALDVVVRRGGRRVGHRTLTAASGPRTSFSVRLNPSSRARLRRAGHLDLKIDASASGPGTRVSTGTTARVTR